MKLEFRFLVLLLLLWTSHETNSKAQEFVLRDLTRIRDVAIEKIEDDGVMLVGGRKLTWDSILLASVGDSDQTKVDQEIKIQGLPLFRLKQRLRKGNVGGAFEIASEWYLNKKRSFGGADANFLVCRTIMEGRIRQQDAVGAVEPMIRALQLKQQCSQQIIDEFGAIMFADGELESKICEKFIPAWSNVEKVRMELDRLADSFDLDSLAEQYPGLAVYLSSMAVFTQQRERMENWNAAIGAVPELRPWQRLLGSDLARMPLSRLLQGTTGSLRVTAMYWWATAVENRASKNQRLLTLLKIMANYSTQYPDFMAIVRTAASRINEDPKLARALEQINQ